MTLILVAIAIAVVTFGSGIMALFVQQRLPDAHKSDSSSKLITQVSALVSLLLAMVLGTLVGTSFAFFFTQKASLDVFAAQALQFDQALAQYGPETRAARAKLKDAMVRGHDLFWGHDGIDPATFTVAGPLAQEAVIDEFLASLQPQSEAQKQALAKANQYASAMEQSRLLISLQVAGQSVPWQLVAILAVWGIALFFGYGLFAALNATTIAALAFGAVSISLAIFLIFDLRQPYTGAFRVSPAALEQTIDFLNK